MSSIENHVARNLNLTKLRAMNLPEWAEEQQTRSEALVKSNAKLLEALNNSNHGVLPGLLPHAIGRALKSTRGRNAVYQHCSSDKSCLCHKPRNLNKEHDSFLLILGKMLWC